MKNIVLLFNENLLQLENIRANYNYISLTILTNNKIKKKSEKKFKLFEYTPKKKTRYKRTAQYEFLRDLLYNDLDKYFFCNLRLNVYFDIDKHYDYYYDEYKYTTQYIYVGEILNSKTIDLNGNPEFYGLYCERIFGPIVNYSCQCKKYYNLFFTQKRCNICFIELIHSKVRRYRLSYTELLYPIIQVGYLPFIKLLLNVNSYNISITSEILGNLINLNCLESNNILKLQAQSKLINIFFSECIFFQNLYLKNKSIFEKNKIKNINIFFEYFNNYRTNYIIKDFYNKKTKELDAKYIIATKLSDKVDSFFYRIELFSIRQQLHPSYFYQFVTIKKKYKLYNSYSFQYLRGTDILRSLLEKINLKTEIWKLYSLLHNKFDGINTNVNQLIKKLRILESFYYTKIELENLIMSFIPILSPNLRPFLINSDDLVMTGDINTLYKLIIENNNLIIIALFASKKEDITSHREYIQQYVNCLITLSKNNNIFEDIENKDQSRGLISILKSKKGHFRNLLLGKRVDYSGRTVITPGPYLRINQCSIPYEILIKLFEEHISKKIIKDLYKTIKNLKFLKNYIKVIFTFKIPIILQLLKQTILKEKILLNRAPTLHKYGIQSFDIVINLNKNLRLHPLVCEGFNADFDGDQMGIHIPVSNITNIEYTTLMQTSLNIFSSRYSQFIAKPSHEIVMGCFYLNLQNNNFNIKIPNYFFNEEEAFIKYFEKKIFLHSSILIQYCTNYIFLEDTNLYINTLFDDKWTFKIKIHKSFIFNKKKFQIYLFTNIGLIICQLYIKNIFYIKNIYYKTTIGKLLFYNNCKNIIKKLHS